MTLPLLLGMALLVAAALALLLWPLFRDAKSAGSAAGISRSGLNAAVYRDQLNELERDRAAGTLDEPAFAQSTQELQRRALADTAAADPAVAQPARAKLSTSLIAGMAVIIPLAAALLYAWLGAPDASREQTSQAVINDKHMEDMVATLAARLEKNPDDTKGWAMLARSYKALGRFDLAEQAFGHVGDVLDQDANVLADYAEVLARRANGDFTGKPQAALNKALQLDPDNAQVLAIAGIAAYQRHEYNEAADYWERLKATLPPDSEQAKSVADSIAKARLLAGDVPRTPAGTIDSWMASSNKTKPAAPGATTTTAPSTASSLRGRVTLSKAIAAQVKPDATLYVFARAIEGKAVTVAALRTTAASLPLEFTLDDSQAMNPQFKLSALPAGAKLRVEARISQSGEAMAQPGDLTGSLEPVKPGTQGIKIVIDHTIPAPLAENIPAKAPATTAPATAKTAATAGAVSGRLTLAAALAAQVKPDDTLFIFARAVEGPRVPLAVLRTTAGALPLDFTLDDSLSMSPQFRLSTVPAGAKVQVEARVSKSGEALPKAGDLIGSAAPVAPGTKGVNIVIERTVP